MNLQVLKCIKLNTKKESMLLHDNKTRDPLQRVSSRRGDTLKKLHACKIVLIRKNTNKKIPCHLAPPGASRLMQRTEGKKKSNSL